MKFDPGSALYALLTILVVAGAATASNTDGHGGADDDVPKHVRRIYRKFKQGRLPRKGINSVRCIRAHEGSLSSNGRLLFNLDAVHKQEELIKAKIHFYRRSEEGAAAMLQTNFYEISPYYQSLVQSELIKSGGSGWVSVDITPTIKQCTNTISQNNQLAVSFYEIDESREGRPLNADQVSKRHRQPYLLVYTNDSSSLESDQIEGLNEQTARQPQASAGSGEPKEQKAVGRRRRSATMTREDEASKRDLIELDRKMNKVSATYQTWVGEEDYFNELTNAIETPFQNSGVSNRVPSPNEVKPASSAPRTNPPAESTSAPTTSPTSSPTTASPAEADAKLQLIPWPRLPKKKRVRDEERLPAVAPDHAQLAAPGGSGCQRRPMRLDFEDIGWGLRIIEPKKYEAYYCSGQCGFPSLLGTKPTNHATLQSILSSLHRSTDIPQPCCVADKLSPLTLMFHDGRGNVVVKQYENMVVESCTCR